MDKDMIKRYGLEEDVKRFQAITEYTFISQSNLDEDDGDEQPDDGQPTPPAPTPDVPQQPQGDGGGQPQIPQPDNGGGGMPPQQQPQQPAMPADGMPPMNGGDQPGGDMPAGPDDAGDGETIDIDMDDDPESGGDSEEEVTIDVDSLVKSQDEVKTKLDAMTGQLMSVYRAVDMFGKAMDSQGAELARLRDEFRQANPTETEILNLRSQSGAPFDQQPKDYWADKKSELPNYNVMMDNSVTPAEEQDAAKIPGNKSYDITLDDVSNINPREVEASFDEPLTLKNFVRI